MVESRTRRTRSARLSAALGGVAALAAVFSLVGAGSGSSAALACATPTFTNGLSQNVFTATSSQWVRGEAWVQTPDDSDHDGVPDRVHVDITRPARDRGSELPLRAPVMFEDSPYYAGIGTGGELAVDHELGSAARRGR